jgi:hypothetical protein
VTLDPAVPIVVNTLSGALYMGRYNDISFTVGGRLVVLIEHQSTINRNMPLRLLLYIARVYEQIIEGEKKGALYRERQIRIPAPEFIVLYNGTKACADRQTLRLSGAFEAAEGIRGESAPELELTVKVININRGHNEDMVRRSGKLYGYSTFMEKVRENRKTMPLEAAMKEAVAYCIDHDILGGFLKTNASEVMNMLLTEWNWDDARDVWQEEAGEEGREEAQKYILDLVKRGYTAEQIEGMLDAGSQAPGK